MTSEQRDQWTAAGQFEIGIVWLLTFPYIIWVASIYALFFRSGLIGGMVAVIEIVLGDVRRLVDGATVVLGLIALRSGVPVRRKIVVWIGALSHVLAQMIITANHYY